MFELAGRFGYAARWQEELLALLKHTLKLFKGLLKGSLPFRTTEYRITQAIAAI